MTLLRINQLPPAERRQSCGSIIPPAIWQHVVNVDPPRFGGGAGNTASFNILAPPGRPEIHLRAPTERVGGDFALSLDLDEAGGGQLELSFIIINDLKAPRFNIDVNVRGQLTLLGTASRNIPEEERAVAAGLGPCQVRRGLRMFGELLPRLEAFAKKLGYVAIILEPLTYHNAVMYEQKGFGYLVGKKRMELINREFGPQGRLTARLDGRNPFRDPAHRFSPRGRSWAIHDNILEELDGQGHLELKMVKVIGEDANQRTFSLM